ncbi:MAG: hypothetical protein R3D29_05955 [Nitratireductor sp.]
MGNWLYERNKSFVGRTVPPDRIDWLWQERFAEAVIAGLLRDKTRSLGETPIPVGKTAKAVRQTRAPRPHEASHRTARRMAKSVGLGVATVQRICNSRHLRNCSELAPCPHFGHTHHHRRELKVRACSVEARPLDRSKLSSIFVHLIFLRFSAVPVRR